MTNLSEEPSKQLKKEEHRKYIINRLEYGKGKTIVVYFENNLECKRYNPPRKRDTAIKLMKSLDTKERTEGMEMTRQLMEDDPWATVRTYNRVVGKLRNYKKEVKWNEKDPDRYNIEFEFLVILEDDANPKEILEQVEKKRLDNYTTIARDASYPAVDLDEVKDVEIIK